VDAVQGAMYIVAGDDAENKRDEHHHANANDAGWKETLKWTNESKDRMKLSHAWVYANALPLSDVPTLRPTITIISVIISISISASLLPHTLNVTVVCVIGVINDI